MDNRPATTQDHCHKHCVSWSAIFFGAIVAVGLGFIFNLFSLAMGLTAFPATAEGKTVYAASGFAWLTILSILSMYIAGWSAGYIARIYTSKHLRGEFYGFGAWCLALVITVFLASQVGQFLNQKMYTVDRSNPSFQVVHQITQEVKQVTMGTKKSAPPMVEKENAQALGMTTFATFFILFIGALSATFGGRVGMGRHYS